MPNKQDYCNEDCRTLAQAKARDEKKARRRAEAQTYREEVADALFRDGYQCIRCGGAAADGIRLVVVPDEEKLKTLCTNCAKERSNVGGKSSGS